MNNLKRDKSSIAMKTRSPVNGLRRTGCPRAALFVDFDNIYIGLNSLDSQAAESFGSNPAGWLEWIENGMPAALDSCQDAPGGQRSVLIRNCYLNPRTFYRFRPYFTRSAFTIVDCPPLTEKGKTSSDIRMVMDVLDTLKHETRFDEYIILSGDADFTPVLQRLRAYDRRTTVLAVGPASEAYKSACDYLISVDNFIEFALGVSGVDTDFSGGPNPGQGDGGISPRLLARIADLVYERASTDGEILAANLPKIYGEFDVFRSSSDWLGYGSLRRLTQAVVACRSDLALLDSDPWKVVVAMPVAGERRKSASAGASAAGADFSGDDDDEVLPRRVVDFVRGRIEEADRPLLMAKMAQEVVADLGEGVLTSQWAGAGTFKALIESYPESGIAIFTAPGLPAYLLDPDRHTPPSQDDAGCRFADLPPSLTGLIQRIHNLTHTPDLTPEEYADVFQSLEEVLQSCRYHFTGTSKMVRDRCLEKGYSISRATISFILRGISYGGHRFGLRPEKDRAGIFADVFRKNVINLCADAQLDLSPEERDLLESWICDDIEPCTAD